jgi:hypothetical protein
MIDRYEDDYKQRAARHLSSLRAAQPQSSNSQHEQPTVFKFRLRTLLKILVSANLAGAIIWANLTWSNLQMREDVSPSKSHFFVVSTHSAIRLLPVVRTDMYLGIKERVSFRGWPVAYQGRAGVSFQHFMRSLDGQQESELRKLGYEEFTDNSGKQLLVLSGSKLREFGAPIVIDENGIPYLFLPERDTFQAALSFNIAICVSLLAGTALVLWVLPNWASKRASATPGNQPEQPSSIE